MQSCIGRILETVVGRIFKRVTSTTLQSVIGRINEEKLTTY